MPRLPCVQRPRLQNTVPGPGAKGLGTGAIRNYQKWQELCVNMDTICENGDVDTSYDFFGHKLAIPVMAGPVGAVTLHYSDKHDDLSYNNVLVEGCANAGIIAFTGDGTNPAVMEATAEALRANGGCGVPTVKPWNLETVRQKMDLVKAADPCAIAMDIDAAGLPFLKGLNPPAGSKTVDQLKEIAAMGRQALYPQGHHDGKGCGKGTGSRSRRHCRFQPRRSCVGINAPATAEVLPAIVDAVGGKMKVFVDGGIRSGMDVFKALALGADAVLIARPFVTMVYGGGQEGRAGLCGQASGRACGHHGHVRCSQSG